MSTIFIEIFIENCRFMIQIYFSIYRLYTVVWKRERETDRERQRERERERKTKTDRENMLGSLNRFKETPSEPTEISEHQLTTDHFFNIR